MTSDNKAKRIAPLQEQMDELRGKQDRILEIKDSRINPIEKLPKDNIFYKHYQNAK